jgi:hypothetical protein
MLHNLAPALALDGMIAGCLVFARRFAALGQRGWVAASVAAAVAVAVLTCWPDLDGISVRLVLASAIQFGFVAALAAYLGASLRASTPVAARIQPTTSRW